MNTMTTSLPDIRPIVMTTPSLENLIYSKSLISGLQSSVSASINDAKRKATYIRLCINELTSLKRELTDLVKRVSSTTVIGNSLSNIGVQGFDFGTCTYLIDHMQTMNTDIRKMTQDPTYIGSSNLESISSTGLVSGSIEKLELKIKSEAVKFFNGTDWNTFLNYAQKLVSVNADTLSIVNALSPVCSSVESSINKLIVQYTTRSATIDDGELRGRVDEANGMLSRHNTWLNSCAMLQALAKAVDTVYIAAIKNVIN